MTNQLTTMASVQENIKDRIKTEFANLIPDEVWAQMIGEVVGEFVNDSQKSNGYGNIEVIPSPLKQMIKSELESIAKKMLKEELDRLGSSTWDYYGGVVASEAIKKMVAENLPSLLTAVQNGIVEMAVMNAVNHIRNGTRF